MSCSTSGLLEGIFSKLHITLFIVGDFVPFSYFAGTSHGQRKMTIAGIDYGSKVAHDSIYCGQPCFISGL